MNNLTRRRERKEKKGKIPNQRVGESKKERKFLIKRVGERKK